MDKLIVKLVVALLMALFPPAHHPGFRDMEVTIQCVSVPDFHNGHGHWQWDCSASRHRLRHHER